MKKYFPCLSLILCGLLWGCGTGHYADYLRLHDIPPPTTKNFIHCYDYGCQKRARVGLENKTKNALIKLFTPLPQTADKERQTLSQAIKIFENDIGALTGTANDKRGTFRLYQDEAKSARTFQQDCIDESTNTTIYLALLQEMALLRFHRPVFPANRQPFLGGAPWWHQTAVIQNIETGEKFAVDSWFRDNGQAAFIVPLQEWKEGWMAPKIEQKL